MSMQAGNHQEGGRAVILQGSPRKNGNTEALLKPFREELEGRGIQCRSFRLYDMKIAGCDACRACQTDWTAFHCPHNDDAGILFDEILAADLVILATPIYSWYCTAPMKALLDRLVYGMNKYYGDKKGPSLWAGKSLAVLTTCGYPPEKGADLFLEGMRRYCKHSGRHYRGALVERHMGYRTVFRDEEKEMRAREFAETLIREAAGS